MIQHIDTEVEKIIIEIDGDEYEMAEKTIELTDKLRAIESKAAGKPEYWVWQEEIKLLLGEKAFAEIFPNGKNENLDRLQSVYAGVVRAFSYHDEQLRKDANDERLRQAAANVAPINELFRNVRSFEKK